MEANLLIHVNNFNDSHKGFKSKFDIRILTKISAKLSPGLPKNAFINDTHQRNDYYKHFHQRLLQNTLGNNFIRHPN